MKEKFYITFDWLIINPGPDNWFGAEHATIHFLNQWWLNMASLGHGELKWDICNRPQTKQNNNTKQTKKIKNKIGIM